LEHRGCGRTEPIRRGAAQDPTAAVRMHRGRNCDVGCDYPRVAELRFAASVHGGDLHGEPVRGLRGAEQRLAELCGRPDGRHVSHLLCRNGAVVRRLRTLWRFWGIVLGVLTNGFVFLLLWPEYAGDKVIDSLAKLMKTSLAFAREVAEGTITEGRIAALAQGLSANLLQVLNFADQARVEGQSGREISASGFDAAATVIRIAYRFEVIARARLSGAEAALPRDVARLCSAREREYCDALESRVEILQSIKSAEHSVLPTSRAESFDVAPAMAALFEGRDLEAQLESYRRLPILFERLDGALSKIAAR